MSFEKPTTEVSGVRSSWLTFDRNVALGDGRRLGRGPGIDEIGGRARPPVARGRSLVRQLGEQPGVVDAGRDEAADRVQQRSVAGMHVATGQAVVDGEDPDDPALGHERRAQERRHPEQLRRTPGCARPGPGRRRGRTSGPSAVASWTSWETVLVEGELEGLDLRGHLGRAAGRAAGAEDARAARR